jgi:hypothetical protein
VIGRRGASLDELEELYCSRFDVFARVAASVTGDSERARDAVQEAFATAVRKRGSFRGEGLLEAIGCNHAEHRRDTRRNADFGDPASGVTPIAAKKRSAFFEARGPARRR